MGLHFLAKRLVFTCAIFLLSTTFISAALPKATTLVAPMGIGYNIGNTMEVPNDLTAWGNTLPTEKLIDSIKAAGFNTVRIPTAWYTHSDTTTNTINAGWLDTIQTIVDYCIANDMYVILNSHWDTGWLEDNVFDGAHPDRNNDPTTTDSSVIRQRQYDYWVQIAEKFKTYDEHLLFAGANEPGVNDPRGSGSEYPENGQYAFEEDRMKILQAYHQAFIDAVRGTGENNATRTLIIQTPRTEFSKADLLQSHMPTDPAGAGYLMAEIHFYPYQFTLMEEDASWGSAFYYWGAENHPTDTERNSSWGGPAYVDSVFSLMKDKFTSQDIPVVVGEFGAIKRLNAVSGENLARHLRSRALFYGKVAQSAKSNGLIPVLWDTGHEGDKNMTVIRRQSSENEVGQITDYEVLNAMREAYDLDTLEGNSIDSLVALSLDNTNKSVSVDYNYTENSEDYSSLRVPSTSSDLSEYTGMEIRAYVSGNTEGSGFFSMDLAVMTGSEWDWTDAHFGTLAYDEWKDYRFTFTSNETEEDKDNQVLYLTDASSVNAFVIQSYLSNFSGNVQIDHILLLKADGSKDTLESFQKLVPETEGAITSTSLVPTVGGPSSVISNPPGLASGIRVSLSGRQLVASFVSTTSGNASVVLMNALGQPIAQKQFNASLGQNEITLQANYSGLGILVVQQGSVQKTARIMLK